MPEPPAENVLIHALIDEYLEYNRLNACRSLLETGECPLQAASAVTSTAPEQDCEHRWHLPVAMRPVAPLRNTFGAMIGAVWCPPWNSLAETGWRAGAGLGRPVIAHELGLTDDAASRRDGTGRPVPLLYEAVQLLSCLRAARAASRRGDGMQARRVEGRSSDDRRARSTEADELGEQEAVGIEPADAAADGGGLRRFRAAPMHARSPADEGRDARGAETLRPTAGGGAGGGRLASESSATARARLAYADAVARARAATAEDMGHAQGLDARGSSRSGMQGTMADDPADAPSAASSPERPVRLAGWGSVPASSVPGGGGTIRRSASSSARERQGQVVSFRMDA